MEHRPRALTRSIDSTIGGVAAGVAEYLRVDPTIVRALWVVGAVFAPPFACFSYLLLWAIMPGPVVAPLVSRRSGAPGGGLIFLGVVLLAACLMWMSGGLAWVGWGMSRFLIPTLLVVAGVLLLTKRSSE